MSFSDASAAGILPLVFSENRVAESSPTSADFPLTAGHPRPAYAESASAVAEPPLCADLSAIVFTDIAGSTAMTEKLGDIEAVWLIRHHNIIVRSALQAHAGREIKFTGDGFHLSFTEVAAAVAFSIDLQRRIACHNDRCRRWPLQLKIGISAGTPVWADNDQFGSAVNLAARLCDRAAPGQILSARPVADLCHPQPLLFTEQSPVRLRGFKRRVRVSDIGWQRRMQPRETATAV